MFNRKRDRTQSLRDVLTMSRASENLDSLPDRFANIIDRYDNLDVDPQFRQDVYNILNGAAEIAEAMVDTTFPIEKAGTVISEQLTILARALQYLQSRPAAQGFAILLPDTQTLVGLYTTREEAETQLNSYRGLGLNPLCLVVPAKVLSQHAVQPKKKRLSAPLSAPQRQIIEGPLPLGIVPEPRQPSVAPPEMAIPLNNQPSTLQSLQEKVQPEDLEVIPLPSVEQRMSELEKAVELSEKKQP